MLGLGLVTSPAPAQSPPPAAPPATIERGVRLHDAGRFDEAIAVYRDVLAADPSNIRAHYEIAYSSMAKKDLPGAIAWLERGLALSPPNANEFYHLLGIAREATGNLTAAEDAFRRAVAAAPTRGPLHFSLGLNLAGQSRFEEATRAFEANLRLRPAHARGWLFLGQAVERQDQSLRAFAAFVRFLTLDPNDPLAGRTSAHLSALLTRDVTAPGPGGQGLVIHPPAADHRDERGQMAIIAARRYVLGPPTDAAFLAWALDRVLQTLGERFGQASGDILVDARLLAFFDAARAAGHLEALAYDVQRPGGDAEARAWLSRNADAVERYRKWSTAWSSSLRPPDR
jgi:tetratricopeptide (TPR) repeat protein